MIYRTEYMQRLKAFKDNKIIKVVTGLRRCGKSTLLKMFQDELLQSGIQPEQIQYFNFELMKYDSIRNYKQLYDLVTTKTLQNKKIIDSFQKKVNPVPIKIHFSGFLVA